MMDFNPRSPCGERRPFAHNILYQSYFNPRSPCGERRSIDYVHSCYRIFQSTLPVRGATGSNSSADTCAIYFNPRSPCGERHRAFLFCSAMSFHFNPRSPCGERLTGGDDAGELIIISIHAPRAGSDSRLRICLRRRIFHFNPRSPCGERHFGEIGILDKPVNFNPRSPCGERRWTTPRSVEKILDFNPRSPCGERPIPWRQREELPRISIHAPRAGSDYINLIYT